MDNVNSPLQGWKTERLGALVREINSGYACGKHSRTGKGIVHFRPYNITLDGTTSFDTVKLVDPAFAEKRLDYGDVVFNNTNSAELVGKTCYYNRKEEVGFSNHMTRIKVDPVKLNFKYLAIYLHFLFLSGFFHKIMKHHVNQASVNTDALKEIQITYPALSVQAKIVQEIEKQLTRLEASTRSLKSLKAKLEVYRKSVLKAAFEEKLIDIKGQWIDASLGATFTIIMGQSPPSTRYNKIGEGLPFFQGKKEFGKIYASIEIWCTEPTKIAEKDDVLLSVRAPIGPVNLAPSRCGIGRGLAAIRKNEKTQPKFIMYLIKSKEIELTKRGTGTTFNAITKPKLFSLPIRVPILKDDRDTLLEAIESRFSVIDKIEQIVQRSEAESAKLKKSILKSAFEGKLVKE